MKKRVYRRKNACLEQRRCKILAWAMVLLVGFLAVLVAAISYPGLDEFEYSKVDGSAYYILLNNQKYGQGITIGTTGINDRYNLTGVSFWLQRNDNPLGTLNITFSLVNGTIVTENSSVTGASISDAAMYQYNFTMPNYVFERGQSFRLAINCSLCSGTDNVRWERSGAYAGGTADLNGVNTTDDIMFVLYGTRTENSSMIFNGTTYETALENFAVNVSFNSAVYDSITAIFNYNGASYSTTSSTIGNYVIFSRNLYIPTTSTAKNIDFNWSFYPVNATGMYNYNSSVGTQAVNPLLFGLCNSTLTSVYANFTHYNETSLVNISATSEASFFYKLNNGGGSLRNNSFTITNSSFLVCSNSGKNLVASSIIKSSATGYYTRLSNFNLRNYSNVTTEESLYLTSEGTNIVIQIKDSNMMPKENVYTDIYRYYPGSNSYQIVVREVSDIYGEFTARLLEGNAKYSFTFKDSNNTILKTAKDITIACKATICILPFILEDTTNDFSRFENVSNYDWTFTFNNNTHIFLFTWTDVSGVSATNRLYVERTLINGTTSVCNSTSTAAAGSLSCNVGSSSASYRAQIFRKIGSGTESRLAVLNEKVGTASRTFGKEGLIWSFFLMMTCIAFGFWKPPVGILLYGVSFLILTMLPIIYVNPAILIAEGVIVIVFIWAFRS